MNKEKISFLNKNNNPHIWQAIDKGINKFHNLFSNQKKRLLSQVHSEDDIKTQSYILAIPSYYTKEDKKTQLKEIEEKAFMVSVSHWLDDIMDSRGGLDMLQYYNTQTQTNNGCYEFPLHHQKSKTNFEGIHKNLIISHTSTIFYNQLIKAIEEAVFLPENRKYLYFSLNRVAMGSSMYGPEVEPHVRAGIIQQHNSKILELVHKESGSHPSPWHLAVNDLLQNISSDKSVGKHFLGMTTKTTQEMAMSSENIPLSFACSVLYSLLYAPLLYFHDIEQEIKNNEMIYLDAFNRKYKKIIPWLHEIRHLLTCKNTPLDPRKTNRLEQINAAWQCFCPCLPKNIALIFQSCYNLPRTNSDRLRQT